jgi:hypothetical protein
MAFGLTSETMTRDFLSPRNLRTLAGCGLLAVAVLGCERTPPDESRRYVPEAAPARAALAAVLEGWKAGRVGEKLSAGGRGVEVVDSLRRSGRPLRGFEILGEVATDRARGFAVRLDLDRPEEEQATRYLVIGLEPLWVFRQEDYDMISHWEHAMPPEKPDEPAKAPEAGEAEAPKLGVEPGRGSDKP